MKVRNKVIVVTCAGSGIGRELTLQLLKNGANVAGVDMNFSSLAQTGDLAGDWREQFAGFQVSVTDIDAVCELPDKVIARFGTVDGGINNAGIVQPFIRLNDL